MTSRAAVWWVIWRDNKAAALRVCDEIVATREPPPRLLRAIERAPLVEMERKDTPGEKWAKDHGAPV